MFRRKPNVVVERQVRDPYYKIEGVKRFGYDVRIVDESRRFFEVDYRAFRFGRRRAERWAQRALGRYLRKRAHQEFVKTGHTVTK